MADVATNVRDQSLWPVVKKRWRAWLRAVHRDVGYLAIGFTVIYAVSGIAQNHIEDWGEVSYKTYETTATITPVADDAPDALAIKAVADAAGLGTPTASFRAGDEVRLEYANGAKATAIGSELVVQGRQRRTFIGAANWLHTARNKSGWRYVADAYALLLMYLAISGIFMIKGRLGLKWRGALLISIGVAVPVTAVLVSGPAARATKDVTTTADTASGTSSDATTGRTETDTMPTGKQPPAAPAEPAAASEAPRAAAPPPAEAPPSDEGSGIKLLPPEE
jgi:uncharacterized protein